MAGVDDESRQVIRRFSAALFQWFCSRNSGHLAKQKVGPGRRWVCFFQSPPGGFQAGFAESISSALAAH